MNQYRNTDKDIHKRIYRFIVDCFKDIVNNIQKKPATIPIIGQLSASLTSMGANDQEADASGSKKDFVAKYKIVKKESKETVYWLSFLRDTGIFQDPIIDKYIQEGDEILRIVSKIIENTRD